MLKSNKINITGYIEGYYGKLLSWEERKKILKTLADCNLTNYFFAPKAEPFHRKFWRELPPKSFSIAFGEFCDCAKKLEISTIAGISPGIDFDFIGSNKQIDFQFLLRKVRYFLDHGVDHLALLIDDVDDRVTRSGSTLSEGHVHASLANRLAQELGTKIFVVPRVYADEIARSSPDYLKAFISELDIRNVLIYSGKEIVSNKIPEGVSPLMEKLDWRGDLVVWDNFYANDYCPRRLFVGPWLGRDYISNILINPTGLVQTDQLLLKIYGSSTGNVKDGNWKNIIKQSGIPEEFFIVAKHFYNPFNRVPKITSTVEKKYLSALDILLWEWIEPLALEWFNFFQGMRQDILTLNGTMSTKRIRRIQSGVLAPRLIKS